MFKIFEQILKMRKKWGIEPRKTDFKNIIDSIWQRLSEEHSSRSEMHEIAAIFDMQFYPFTSYKPKD